MLCWNSSAIFTMAYKFEQRLSIKFCVDLKILFSKNLGRICQFIDKYSLNRHQIFEWHARFETCRVSVQISEQSPENATKRKINDFLNRSVDVQSVISLLLMTALSYGVSIAIIAWELSDKRKKKLVITVISDQ